MALDYEKIRRDKKGEYGTKVGNYGRLIANLYSDRTHFILELLQNAEDALRDRGSGWQGSRAVSFHLTKDELRLDHFGRPFDEADVRGICEIGESAKADDLTAIGRFGIGFKSVYAITERPEIHSGPEDFAIENYVLPVAVPTLDRELDDTVILLPLKSNGETPYNDIATGLKGLGASSLLFLRQIEEVRWQIDDGRSGHYLRESKSVEEDIRRVTVVGQTFGEQDASAEWLVFSRAVSINEDSPTGHVELAFNIDPDSQSIRPVSDSRLVVFFPTTLETHLGFLMQGPYQTTPSRDNVPSHVQWNKHLIYETSLLLLRALRWLRDTGDLTTDVLRCLPLSSQRFGADPSAHYLNPLTGRSTSDTNMFTPLFDVTKEALSSEPLLPRLNSGYVSAERALLGRTEGIRQLFSLTQLSALYGKDRDVAWLSSDITQDRAPEIRDYLMRDLHVEEIDPETITRRLNRTFLEEQTDSWILQLYEFLNMQPAIIRMLTGQFSRSYSVKVPLVRLTDGSHAPLGEPQAFLPSDTKTDFPTVRPDVCVTPEALSFLRSLGLREPDLVDDVRQHVLPKYQKKGYKLGDAEYENDMDRILGAFATDSTAQRGKLVEDLQRSMFVRAMTPGTSLTCRSKPQRVYLATEQLKELFDGVEGVRIVDDRYRCLCGGEVRALLEACGAKSHLKAVLTDSDLTYEQRNRMRKGNSSTRSETITDWTLMGLEELMEQLQFFDPARRSDRASLLWQALIDFVQEEGPGPFSGTYRWHYYSWHNSKFPAKFVKQLNETAWIPDEGNTLRRPCEIVFATLDWEEHSFLLSQIAFMQPEPPIVQTLAREVGIEPESLDLIRQHGVTAERLKEWLGLNEDPTGDRTSEPLGTEAGSQGDSRSADGRRTANGDLRDEMGHNQGLRRAASTSTGQDGATEPFAKLFFGTTANVPFLDSRHPVVLPEDGPLTEESASHHTQQSNQYGRSGEHIRKTVTRWEPTEAGKSLAGEFKAMVHSDYAGRCQICGATFRMRNGELQTFVVHVVEPSGDSRANHFGDLMGLCGLHFSLVRYADWSWLSPETNTAFEDSEGREAWEHWQSFVLNAEGTDAEKTDVDGNTYIGLPIRFWNLYEDWNAEPFPVDGIVRYTKPHWKYLCELIKDIM